MKIWNCVQDEDDSFHYESICGMEINLLCLDFQPQETVWCPCGIPLPEKNLNLGFGKLFSEAKLGCQLGNESSLQMW